MVSGHRRTKSELLNSLPEESAPAYLFDLGHSSNTSFHSLWPSFCFSDTQSLLLPQDLCTCCSRCQDCSFSRSSHNQLPFIISISLKCHLLRGAFPDCLLCSSPRSLSVIACFKFLHSTNSLSLSLSLSFSLSLMVFVLFVICLLTRMQVP